jgi:DNA-binding MarR family transcriptional regulator
MRQAASLHPLDRSIGYVLKQATTVLHAAMAAALRPHGLTVPQYSCLELLSQRPEQSNAELARGMFVTPQSMNEVLRGLQNRSLVERPREVAVGRARPTHLTSAGRTRLEHARMALVPVERRMLRGMTRPDQDQVLTYLRTVIHNLEHHGDDGAADTSDPGGAG